MKRYRKYTWLMWSTDRHWFTIHASATDENDARYQGENWARITEENTGEHVRCIQVRKGWN